MKITIKSLDKTFFFIDTIALTPTVTQLEVDLSTKSDLVKAGVLNAISMGRVAVESDDANLLQNIVNSISDKKLREKFAKKVKVKFVDSEVTTEVEVKVLEKEKAAAVITPDSPAPVAEETEEAEDPLANLIKGPAAKVIEALAEQKLSSEDAAKLLALEKDNKNRATVKAVLEKLI